MTAAMLLLVFTLVEAPDHGFLSLRTIGSFVGVAVILAAFVARERRAASPLVRLGILRSGNLVRANLGAMALFGGWVGFQFVTTLYLQGVLGWSPLKTGLAIFPGGALVVLLSPAILPLIARFGTTQADRGRAARRPAPATRCSCRSGSTRATPLDMLPTFLLAGIGFALAFGPLNVEATSGVAAEEQGLAGGLLNTSFQFGGALVLAIVTAVNNAYIGPEGGPQAVLDGFHAALYVSVAASVFGIVALHGAVGRGSCGRADGARRSCRSKTVVSKRPPVGHRIVRRQAVAPSATLTATITAPASETAPSEVEKLVEKNCARSAASATSSKATTISAVTSAAW